MLHSRYLREPFNGVSHVIAALFAFAGVTLLLRESAGNLAKQITMLIYGVSLVGQFAASAAYHLLDLAPTNMQRLKKLDHSAIYLLIAGTNTPIAFVVLDEAWRWGVLALLWTVAILGIFIKVFVTVGRRGISVSTYLLMGWLGLIPIVQLIQRLPLAALVLLALGGLFYTIGAGVYAAKHPDPYPGVFGFHEIWHLFVIGGSLCHYLLILWYIAPFEQF